MLEMAITVNDAVCSALEALDKFAPGEFLIITHLDPEAGETTLPVGSVRRVLIELIREVKRRTPGGALLEIATGRTALSADETWPGIRPGNYLSISITVRTAGDVSPRFDLLKMLGIAQSGGAHLTVTAQKNTLTTLRLLMPQDGSAPRLQRQCFSEKTIRLAGDGLEDRSPLRRLLLDQGYILLEPGNQRCVDAVFTTFGRSIDLAVVHRTSESAGGALPDWLASSPGIPIVVCTVQQQGSVPGQKVLHKIRRLLDRPHPRQSILVVDEDHLLRPMIVAVLEAAGYEVREAGDGNAALRSAAKQKPDAVLTEMVLPGTNGLQLVQALRKSGPDIKIIAMSGSSRADTYLLVARSLGANAALRKPLWGEDLLDNIRTVLKDSLPRRLHYVSDGA